MTSPLDSLSISRWLRPALVGALLAIAGGAAARAEAPAASADPTDKLRRELAESRQDLLQARQEADQLRNQLQSAQDDLVVRTREFETKLAQAAKPAAESKPAPHAAAPAVPDHRLADLQATLADTQRMTVADQATIAGLKDDLATAQAALARPTVRAPASPDVARLEADKRDLLAANAKLVTDLKQLRAKPSAGATLPLKDPRVDMRERDLQTALIAAQEQIDGDHRTIGQLQAELTVAKAGTGHGPDQQQRDALLAEVQTALAAAQTASRGDRDALARAQADLEAARGELAQNQTGAADLARAKTDLAAETAAATTAAGQRDQLTRDLADARTGADRTAAALRTQLQEAQAKIAAFTPGPDVAQQLADAQGRVDLFKQRSADLSAQVDQLTAQTKTLAAEVAAAKPPSVVMGAAPAAAPPARWHVVQEGDSLTRISTRYYGTPARWQEIYDANREVLQGETAPVVGQRLRIP
jgi:LysM repeat protein